jgi:hypothetical protein
VAKLMRHNACEEADRMADSVPVVAQPTDESFFGMRSWQQHPIAGEWIERSKEAKAPDQFTNECVHRDHSFSVQFAQRYVDGPLIGADGMETVAAQIGAFADAHAGVANEEKSVCRQIVAAQ